MTFERLGPAILVSAFVFAYFFAMSWLAHRAWRNRRISTRTYAVLFATRLHVPLLIASLVSPLFGVPAGAAWTGVCAVGFLLAIRLAVAVRSVPAFDEALTNPVSTDFGSWTRGEKTVVWVFVAFFVVVSFVLVVLLLALAPGR